MPAIFKKDIEKKKKRNNWIGTILIIIIYDILLILYDILLIIYDILLILLYSIIYNILHLTYFFRLIHNFTKNLA